MKTKEQYEIGKLKKRLRHLTGKAIEDYKMIEDGDRVMVCMSGGKDSYGLMDILLSLKRSAPVDFTLIGVHVSGKFPGTQIPEKIREFCASRNVECIIADDDINSIINRVMPEGVRVCSLCARLRRGILYRIAGEINATKIALGHHRDDAIATFFLNMFYASKIKSMPPKLITDDKKHIVIRPLIYCHEDDMRSLSAAMNYPVVNGTCIHKANKERPAVREMMDIWEKQHPGRLDNILKALGTIQPSHMLDRRMYDFDNLRSIITDSGKGLKL
ncbi:MAG: tRNA 2-thiocytidine(32) synthetase TtcA [Succinivibrionaceae bacterium]|nr:tRNA 2-thiocytidine(32) synthetase TtcA [Pseudomonadota bacterium]MDY3144224.1 tRNA 2-thiocytidine(32) synthetase TtcA [Succinivibrionaceae bacterium]